MIIGDRSLDRLLARVAFEAAWDRDLDTDELNWAGNVESMFGYARDAIVNDVSWWRERVHPEDIGEVDRIVNEALRGDAPGWSAEYRFRRQDGSWAWVASRCALQRDATGRARRAIGAMIDISAVKESESRLRLFLEQIPARACITDRELRVVWDAGAAFSGAPSTVGRSIAEVLPQTPDCVRVLDACAKALAGASSKVEVDNGKTAVELQFVPFRDPGGSITGVVGIAFDVTDRVRIAEEARAGHRLLRQVLEILPVGVIVMDQEGDVVVRNEAARSIWGQMIVRGDERWARSKGFWHATGEEIEAGEWASVRALEDGITSRDELIDIESFDGRRKTIENYAAPIRDGNGPITGAVVVNEDVTERVRAEERLRNTEKLLIEAEKLGQTGTWERDVATQEVFSTEPSRQLFFGDDGSKGGTYQDYVDAVHPDDRDRLLATRQRMLEGTGSGDAEFRVVWPDGSVHWLFGRASVVRDAEGRPIRVFGTNRDITDRKSADEELARRAQQLETLSARLLQSQDEERRRIARELHDTTAQNLGALRLDLSALKRSASDPAMRETIDESIALTERAIAEVRTLSYLLHPPMIEEGGLLPSLRWYAQGFQERTGIAVTLELPDALERLPIATETAVFRIVQEALTNIRRHAESEVAAIRIERKRSELDVVVRDEGRGIPLALRKDDVLFAAAGVGLASMRERARELGGNMSVQSDDHGTTIEIRLPVVES